MSMCALLVFFLDLIEPVFLRSDLTRPHGVFAFLESLGVIVGPTTGKGKLPSNEVLTPTGRTGNGRNIEGFFDGDGYGFPGRSGE